MITRRGVDLSHYNTPVDFGTMKAAGIEFLALKATEGGAYSDPTFADRRARARAVGFEKVLIYHFVQPEVSAGDQAAHFAAVVGSLAENESVVLDVESANGWSSLNEQESSDLITSLVSHLKVALGIHAAEVMLYGSLGWLRGQFGSHLTDLTFMPLWAARYASRLGDVSPWEHATIWQNSESGTVAGAGSPGTVDTDIWLA